MNGEDEADTYDMTESFSFEARRDLVVLLRAWMGKVSRFSCGDETGLD